MAPFHYQFHSVQVDGTLHIDLPQSLPEGADFIALRGHLRAAVNNVVSEFLGLDDYDDEMSEVELTALTLVADLITGVVERDEEDE